MATRSVWSGHLSFGLVSIPIKLFVAARESRVDLHMLHEECGSGVKQKYVCEKCGVEVPRTGGARYYEYSGQKVVLSQKELDSLDPQTSKVASVLSFVKAEEIDPLYLGASFYVAPDEGGAHAFALLLWGMLEQGACALAKITMSARENVVLLRPSPQGLVMHHMFYQNEIRIPDRIPDVSGQILSPEEKNMATLLVEAMTVGFDISGYRDERAAKLMELIEAKHAGVEAETKVVEMPIRETPDILTALKASLEQKKRQA